MGGEGEAAELGGIFAWGGGVSTPAKIEVHFKIYLSKSEMNFK